VLLLFLPVFASADTVVVTSVSEVPSFQVALSASQNLPVASFTKIDWNVENLDNYNYFSTGAYTPQIAGWYRFYTNVRFSGPTANDSMDVAIYKNGASAARCDHRESFTTAHTVSCSIMLQANGTTDYFEVYVFNTSGTADAENGVFSFFWGSLVTPLPYATTTISTSSSTSTFNFLGVTSFDSFLDLYAGTLMYVIGGFVSLGLVMVVFSIGRGIKLWITRARDVYR